MTNEELKKQIDELKTQTDDLKAKVKLLEASATIPKHVEDAFRERLRLETFTPLESSAKSATSESQTVNEAGIATYAVLKNPDGWEQRVINGTVKYYPFWT